MKGARLPGWMLSCLLAVTAWPADDRAKPRLAVVSGVDGSGLATEQWLAVLRRRLPQERYATIAPLRKPLTAQEQAWAALVDRLAPAWEAEVPSVAANYAPVPPPEAVRIVIGNRGAQDAFTHDPRTIGFDLAALQANYGDAGQQANAERMTRFFRHEFTHIMQKAWLAEHPAAAATPQQLALIEMWTEGLGNYESLSGRWQDRDGAWSQAAAQALAELEPRLVARLAALACTTPQGAALLTGDLSNGRFEQKWGALPVALWLQRENATNGQARRDLVVAGPAGIWALAERHLSGPLRAALADARRSAGLCQ